MNGSRSCCPKIIIMRMLKTVLLLILSEKSWNTFAKDILRSLRTSS